MDKRFIYGMITGLLTALAVILLGYGMYTFAVKTVESKYANGYFDQRQLAEYAETVKEARSTGTVEVVKDKEVLTAARKLFDGKVSMLLDYIDYYYYEDVDKNAMYEAMLHALVNEIGDPYSCYYSTAEYEEVMTGSTGNYCGIGSTVTQINDTKQILIVKPYKNSPAEKAGMQPGDEIVEVDGLSVIGFKLDDVVAMMKGEKGTQVNITVLRDGVRIPMELIRDSIEMDYVAHELIEGDVGFILVSSFTEVTPKQFNAAIDDLLDRGMKSLIIDLRDNGGGVMKAATDMLDRLLPKGTMLVYTEDRYGRREYTLAAKEECLDIPIVVLSNGNSASASEIFMGALKALGKAQIVGTKSFGKGVVQAVVPLSVDNSALRITGWRYFTPDGVCIHGTGIEPDVEVAYSYNEDGDGEPDKYDTQIRAAIGLLREMSGLE